MNKLFSKRKIILGILIFLLILPLFARPTLAYPGVEGGSYQFQFEEAIKSDEMNLQSFVNETMKAIVGSIFHFIIGRIPIGIDCTKNLIDCFAFAGGGNQPQGLLPTSLIFMANIYVSPPASGIQYFADLGQKLGVTKPVYAQNQSTSFGFNAMAVTQPIWTVFRNLTYVLFALILVAMGFAIMFRVKISPQAVITIQAAFPKIVIALVLITFSYAIVGLMLDVAIFFNGLLGTIFGDLFKKISLLNPAILGVIETITNWFTPLQLKPLMEPFAVAFAYAYVTTSLFSWFMLGSTILSALGPFAVVGIPSLLFGLIIIILLLIAYLRCIWVLLKALAMIVVNLIFAPLRILIGIFPGSNAISAWFKDIIANIAVLPMMLAMFFIANYLILAGLPSGVKAFVGGGGMTYGLFWIFTSLLFPLVGIVILLLTPKVSDIIQSFITKKPFAFGTAIGEYGQALYRGTTMAYEQYKTKTGKAEQAKRHEELLRALKGEEISKPGSR